MNGHPQVAFFMLHDVACERPAFSPQGRPQAPARTLEFDPGLKLSSAITRNRKVEK